MTFDNADTILGIPRRWWVVATFTPSLTLMGTSATILDIPEIVMIPELDTDHYRYQWSTGAAVLGSVLGMALLRWCRDHFGLKNTYVTGMLIFTLACIPCGLATDNFWFTPMRFLASFGKGLVIANVLATIWREFPLRKDLAMALYGVGLYFGKAVAPTIGAWLTDYPSWRAIFYLNALVALVTFILSWWVLLPDKPDEKRPDPFDFSGLGLLAVWVIALLICLFRGQKWGWTTSHTWIIAFMVFASSLTAWVFRELYAASPLVDLRLFREKGFVLSMVIKSLYMVNFGALITIMADYMVTTRGYPRTTTGLVLLPGALLMGVSLVVSGLIGLRWSRKWRMALGLAGMAIATWQLSVIDLYTDKWLIAFDFCIWGLGAGLVLPPVLCIALETLPQPLVVSSASIKNMVRVLPGTIGSIVIGTMLTRQTDARFDYLRQNIMPNRAVVENVQLALADHLTTRGSSGIRLTDQTQHVIGSYVRANARAFAAETALHGLTVVCVLAMILVFFVRPRTEPA